MDEQQARIQEDLRGLLAGDVRSDDVFLQLYASDASIYQIKPLGVIAPRNTADVVRAVQYASENQIPLHARGSGTSLAGESLGSGLVVDFSRFMRRIVQIDEETVRVQPGVVLANLNEELRSTGRLFGPDPATSQVTTMGSVIAIDAAGSRWLKYGSARRHVRSVQVVLSDGASVELGREPLHGRASRDPNPRKRELVNELAALVERHRELIAQKQPKTLVNRCGYQLDGVLEDGYLDLPRLLAGSEGTLALITEATLSTQPASKYRAVAILFFHRLDDAARAVLEILPFEPTACDLMDRRHISLARETEPRYDVLIPEGAEALLLVEQQGDDAAEVRDRLRQLVDHVVERKPLAFDSRQAFESIDVDLFWRLAQKVVPTLHRLKGTTRPLPFVEDIAVPPDVLPEFLVRLQNILKRHQVTASLFAHAGHGQLHVRPFLDLSDPGDVHRIRDLADDLYEAVLETGGTISGEHGDGLSRTAFVPRQYGPLYNVFREVKRIFDPHNILNPGKIVGDDPDLMTRNLRPLSVATTVKTSDTTDQPSPDLDLDKPLFELQLNWNEDTITHTARSCNGCGACRSQLPDERMCPIFRFAPAESASPRAKANLMRGVLTGELDMAQVASDEFREVADLCVNCQMCRLECPAGVDIPHLMLEAKGAHVAASGLGQTDWVISRVDSLSSLGSRFSPLANWAIGNRAARWVMEKTLGIAQNRKLPRFVRQSFLRRARRRRLTRPTRRHGPKILFFVDTYANYHDTQLGDALVAVLEHNAVAVYVHPRQLPSAMPMLSIGALDAARKVAQQNVTLLSEAVRQGYQIVATEPAAALCLKQEYPALLGYEDADLVAENTVEACSYVWQLHRAGMLQLDLSPVNAAVAYHTPCHIKALEVGTPGLNLLRLIPGLRVSAIEEGCSGMAGTYGLKRENFRNSLRAGRGLMTAMRTTAAQAGTTECTACKMQMEQGTNKPTIHPLKLLALSYGLMPQVAGLLSAQSEELIVT